MKNTDLLPIDHVPTANALQVAIAVREWFKANAFMALKDSNYAARQLEDYEGGHLTVELGGYVRDPDDAKRQLNIESTVTVGSGYDQRLDDVIDPEGTVWHRHGFRVTVGWNGGCGCGVKGARMMATMADVTVTLAERFNEAFGDAVVWTKGLSQADRDAAALKLRRDTTQLAVASFIKESIHTTCRGMRVGDERTLTAPEVTLGMLQGDYEVALEKKEYRASVFTAPWAGTRVLLSFRRTL